MRILSGLSAVMASLALAAAPASAQVNPFRESLINLQEDDFKLLSAAAYELYASATAKTGDKRQWRNDKTGNSGTIEIIQVYEWRGLLCRKLQHTLRQKGILDPLDIRVDRCQTASGEWKIRS